MQISVLKTVQGPFISDHCIIIATVGMLKQCWTRKQIEHHKLKDIDIDEMGTLLQAMLAKVEMSNCSGKELAQDFHSIATTVLDVFAPKRTSLQTIHPCHPWHNEEIKWLKHRKRRMERIWKDYPTTENWNLFKQMQSAHKYAIRMEKRRIISQHVLEAQGDPWELYNLTKSLTGTIPENPLPEALSDFLLAEDFSNFFHTKIANIHGALQDYPAYIPPLAADHILFFSEFVTVTEDVLYKVIHSLPPRSCELDALPARIFRGCIPYILEFLKTLINRTLETGQFIMDWKTSIYKPLIKGPNLPTAFKSYRPVSNVPFLSKVAEKVVMEQFQNHCNAHDLFPTYQSTYRRNFSCETSIARIMVDLLSSFEQGKVTAMLFMDLSAAFDTVDHDILCQVLQRTFKVENTCLNWLKTYLSPHWTKVCIGRDYSQVRRVTCSVPQGSCLGPILYTVYVSTLQ